jgi:hypothetical protein
VGKQSRSAPPPGLDMFRDRCSRPGCRPLRHPHRGCGQTQLGKSRQSMWSERASAHAQGVRGAGRVVVIERRDRSREAGQITAFECRCVHVSLFLSAPGPSRPSESGGHLRISGTPSRPPWANGSHRSTGRAESQGCFGKVFGSVEPKMRTSFYFNTETDSIDSKGGMGASATQGQDGMADNVLLNSAFE